MKLQGREELNFDLAGQLWEYTLKRKLFIIQINNDFMYFSQMNQQVEHFNCSYQHYVNWLQATRKIWTLFFATDKLRVASLLTQYLCEFNVNTE